MSQKSVFLPEELAGLQSVYNAVTARLTTSGYNNISAAEVSTTVMQFAGTTDVVLPDALDASVYQHLTYDG